MLSNCSEKNTIQFNSQEIQKKKRRITRFYNFYITFCRFFFLRSYLFLLRYATNAVCKSLIGFQMNDNSTQFFYTFANNNPFFLLLLRCLAIHLYTMRSHVKPSVCLLFQAWKKYTTKIKL